MGRTGSLLTLGFGVILFVTAGWVYRELLWSIMGVLDSTGVPTVQAFDRGGRIAVLDSRYTAEANRARGERGIDPAWLRANLATWSAFLEAVGADFDLVSDYDVEDGRLDAYDLVVLPSTSALSDLQIENVKAFLYEGGGVLATWAPGVYRPDGSWRGWRFIEEAFGVLAERFIERASTNFRVYTDTFPGLAHPGLYRPTVATEAVDAPLSDRPSPARATSFLPLSGYTWTASLDAQRPAASFALADTLTVARFRGGTLQRQPSTRVQFFTWLGGDPAAAAEAAHADAAFGRVTFRAGTPLAAGLPAAFRMKTGTFDTPLSLRVVEPRAAVAASWFDFAASDLPAHDALPYSAAVVYGTYGDGRFVYLGHELSAMGFDPTDRGALARVFENALRWLGRAPMAWVDAWPAGHRGAAFVAGVAPGNPLPLEAMLGPFREYSVPATLFLRTDAAEYYPELSRRLATRAELALLVDANLSADRLRDLRARMAAASGTEPAGIRLTVAHALSARAASTLAEVGFEYAVPDTLGRALSPFATGPVITIPRTARTDRRVLARTPEGTPEARLALLLDDIARTEIEGGLYTLLVHPDGLGQPNHLPLVREALRTLQERGFWLPSGRELANWSAGRDGLTVRVETPGPRRLHLRVSNGSRTTVDRATVTISLPAVVQHVAVRSELVGTPDPDVHLDASAELLTLTVDRLAPGQYRVYQIDLTYPTPAAGGTREDEPYASR